MVTVMLTRARRYVYKSALYLQNKPSSVSAAIGKHLLAQRDPKGVPYFKKSTLTGAAPTSTEEADTAKELEDVTEV